MHDKMEPLHSRKRPQRNLLADSQQHASPVILAPRADAPMSSFSWIRLNPATGKTVVNLAVRRPA